MRPKTISHWRLSCIKGQYWYQTGRWLHHSEVDWSSHVCNVAYYQTTRSLIRHLTTLPSGEWSAYREIKRGRRWITKVYSITIEEKNDD